MAPKKNKNKKKNKKTKNTHTHKQSIELTNYKEKKKPPLTTGQVQSYNFIFLLQQITNS